MSDWVGGLTVGLTWGAACVSWLNFARTRKERNRIEEAERHMMVMFDKITRPRGDSA